MIIEFPYRPKPIEPDAEQDDAYYLFTAEDEARWKEIAHRVELVIACLQNPYIYIDAEFERHRARYIAQAQHWLAYCRTRVAGTREDAETENEMMDFISRLNLSIDWVFAGDL